MCCYITPCIILILISHDSEGWYMPAPKLEGIYPAVLKLLSVDKTSDMRRNYTFEAKCK